MSGDNQLWGSSYSGNGNGILKVYLYPDSSDEDNECRNAIFYALQGEYGKLLDHDAVSGYEIYINFTHPQLPYDNVHDYFDAFANWRQNYHQETGVHMGVKDSFHRGKANTAEDGQTSAWLEARDAVVGLSLGKELFKNVAIQESLHPFITSGYYSGADDDHELGMKTSSGAVTPMATGYEDTAAETGDCWGTYFHTGYTENITICTKRATKTTTEQVL